MNPPNKKTLVTQRPRRQLQINLNSPIYSTQQYTKLQHPNQPPASTIRKVSLSPYKNNQPRTLHHQLHDTPIFLSTNAQNKRIISRPLTTRKKQEKKSQLNLNRKNNLKTSSKNQSNLYKKNKKMVMESNLKVYKYLDYTNLKVKKSGVVFLTPRYSNKGEASRHGEFGVREIVKYTPSVPKQKKMPKNAQKNLHNFEKKAIQLKKNKQTLPKEPNHFKKARKINTQKPNPRISQTLQVNYFESKPHKSKKPKRGKKQLELLRPKTFEMNRSVSISNQQQRHLKIQRASKLNELNELKKKYKQPKEIVQKKIEQLIMAENDNRKTVRNKQLRRNNVKPKEKRKNAERLSNTQIPCIWQRASLKKIKTPAKLPKKKTKKQKKIKPLPPSSTKTQKTEPHPNPPKSKLIKQPKKAHLPDSIKIIFPSTSNLKPSQIKHAPKYSLNSNATSKIINSEFSNYIFDNNNNYLLSNLKSVTTTANNKRNNFLKEAKTRQNNVLGKTSIFNSQNNNFVDFFKKNLTPPKIKKSKSINCFRGASKGTINRKIIETSAPFSNADNKVFLRPTSISENFHNNDNVFRKKFEGEGRGVNDVKGGGDFRVPIKTPNIVNSQIEQIKKTHKINNQQTLPWKQKVKNSPFIKSSGFTLPLKKSISKKMMFSTSSVKAIPKAKRQRPLSSSENDQLHNLFKTKYNNLCLLYNTLFKYQKLYKRQILPKAMDIFEKKYDSSLMYSVSNEGRRIKFPKKKVIVKELYQIMMKEENLFSLKGETHVEANVIFANLKKYLSLRFKLALLRLYRKLLGAKEKKLIQKNKANLARNCKYNISINKKMYSRLYTESVDSLNGDALRIIAHKTTKISKIRKFMDIKQQQHRLLDRHLLSFFLQNKLFFNFSHCDPNKVVDGLKNNEQIVVKKNQQIYFFRTRSLSSVQERAAKYLEARGLVGKFERLGGNTLEVSEDYEGDIPSMNNSPFFFNGNRRLSSNVDNAILSLNENDNQLIHNNLVFKMPTQKSLESVSVNNNAPAENTIDIDGSSHFVSVIKQTLEKSNGELKKAVKTLSLDLLIV